MELFWQSILVFLAVAVSDVLWAIYIRSISDSKIVKAAIFSALIVLCGALVVIGYTQNNWLIIPAVNGAFVGTIVGMTYKKFLIKRKRKP